MTTAAAGQLVEDYRQARDLRVVVVMTDRDGSKGRRVEATLPTLRQLWADGSSGKRLPQGSAGEGT